MRVSELRDIIKHLPGRTELLLIPEFINEDNKKIKTGIGYFDAEEKELVYIGEIHIIESNED